jgi:hypothetical protein
MRLSSITDPFENKLLIKESLQRNNVLVEGVCKRLTLKQRKVVEGIYKEFRPLIEATLTPDQINKIFTDVETSATASGGNRSALGQGKDALVKANEIINKAGKWLQDTTPVKAFDQKFDNLKRKINTTFPDSKILDGISELGILAQEHPKKTAAIVGILTAVASLAGKLLALMADVDAFVGYNQAQAIDWGGANVPPNMAVSEPDAAGRVTIQGMAFTRQDVSNCIGTFAAMQTLMSQGHLGNLQLLANPRG